MIRRRHKVTLEVTSPFLFTGMEGASLGVDAAQIRDELGRPIIPAEQLRGVLRAACEVLCGRPDRKGPDGGLVMGFKGRAPNVLSRQRFEALFGSESAPLDDSVSSRGGEQNRPLRGSINPSDATCMEALDSGFVTRIAIDDETGAVKEGALLVVELAAGIGKTITFHGELSFLAQDVVAASATSTALQYAMALIPAIGAMKSAGFGAIPERGFRLCSEPGDERIVLPEARAVSDLRRAYRVTFDRPLLVDAERVTDNLFRGQEILPGAALKGALAEKLRFAGVDPEQDADWGSALAAFRISHALPESECEHGDRPSCLSFPASVMAVKTGQGLVFADALLTPPDRTPMIQDRTPSFPIDWKPDWFSVFADGERFPPAADIPQIARMHVAIEDERLIAAEGQLFATLRRSHLRKGRQGADQTWQARPWQIVADGGAVQDPSRAVALFEMLQSGLEPIGRSLARASFTPLARSQTTPIDRWQALRDSEPPPLRPIMIDGEDHYAATLVTPALMLDMGEIAGRPDRRATFQDYRNYWREAVSGELVRAFATTRLAGGYIAMRRRVFGSAYYPFILTDPGSVFLIRNPDREKLQHCIRYGLNPPNQTGGEKPNWRNCAYVPENGFGEIALDLVDHKALARGGQHV